MTITNRLLLFVVGIIMVILAGSFYFHKTQIRSHLEHSQQEWIDTLIKSLSESITKDTINGDKISVQEILHNLVLDDAIQYVYVTDMNGELFAHSFKGGFPRFLLEKLAQQTEPLYDLHTHNKYITKQGEIFELDAPLIEGLRARIHLGLNQSEVNNLIKDINRNFSWFIGLLGLLSISITVYIGRKISLPLTNFTDKLQQYSKDSRTTFPEIKSSDPDIKNLVGTFRNVIIERDTAEKSLLEVQNRLLLHRELSPIGIIEWTTNFEYVDWNPAAEKIFGYTKEEVLGTTVTDNILPESAQERVKEVWNKLITNTGGEHSINENRTKDGKIITCEWHNTSLVNEQGEIISVASFVEDITLQKQQEEQIRRTQKMDAMGKLTGGISHDYNNMLGVIIGYTELLQESLSEQPGLHKYANEIMRAAERGRQLTRKLLSFSKEKVSSAKSIDINNMLIDKMELLQKTLTVRIKLTLELTDDLCLIYVDENDLEDMLLNMSINAMHAMEQSGQLTLATHLEHLPARDAESLNVAEGDYVVFRITDTGQGMDSDTLEHIFEPFYSTKGTHGTGLGLSQVYSFVHRSKGAIKVYSEPGHGTRFAIYFPCYEGLSIPNLKKMMDIDTSLLTGIETILVVDDEISLGQMMQEILEAQGYKVVLATDGIQALEMLKMTTVDLVVTDIIMPEMDGYELAYQIRQHFPKMKIQLVSGFNDSRHQDKIDNKLQQSLLYKPLNSKILLKRIRDLLDEE